MFEHIVLRRAEGGLPISAGQLAEAMFYYQKVQLILDRGTLLSLIQQLGTGRMLSLLNRSDISAVYCEEILATHTESVGVSQFHNYMAFTLSAHDYTIPLKSPADRLQYDLERNGATKKDSRNFAKTFLDRVPIRKFSGNNFINGGIVAAAKRDLLDEDYLLEAVRHTIGATEGGYVVGSDMKFELLESELGQFVFTNIDLKSVNRRRAEFTPPVDPITIAHLLSSILDARADLALASYYGGDFVTSSAISTIIQLKHSLLLRRSQLNVESRQQFTEVVLPDSPSLAEVIDAGERSFDDFLKLLDRAARFKSWLQSVSPDENLIRTYMRDITSEDWIQRLPAKSLRYMLTLALDATNPAIGMISGFTDNFVVEKLLGGWKPNHFVTSRLKPFIQGS